MEKGTWERADLVISTKLHGGGRGAKDTINSIGLSRKHLFEGLQASLERMQLEYVDLVFCHRPDPRTPIEETVRGMNHLLDRGILLVRHNDILSKRVHVQTPTHTHQTPV